MEKEIPEEETTKDLSTKYVEKKNGITFTQVLVDEKAEKEERKHSITYNPLREIPKFNEKLPFQALKRDRPIAGQVFAAVSVLTRDDYGVVYQQNEEPYKGFLMKIHGTFATADQCHNFIKHKLSISPEFDIHMILCGNWTKLDNSAGSVKDNVYEDKMRNDIMTGYFKNEHNKKVDIVKRINSLQSGAMKQDYGDIKKLIKESLHEDLEKHHLEKSKQEYMAKLKDTSRPRRTLAELADQTEKLRLE